MDKTNTSVETPRYCIAKQYRSTNGWRQVWGVYDDVKKEFVEGGFFSKTAASECAAEWNAVKR